MPTKPGKRSLETEVFLEVLPLHVEILTDKMEGHIPFMQEQLTRRQQRARFAKLEIPDMLGLIVQALASGEGLERIQTMVDDFAPRG